MKSINPFADEIAEHRLQEKIQKIGRGPESGVGIRRIFNPKRREYAGFPKKGVIGPVAPAP